MSDKIIWVQLGLKNVDMRREFEKIIRAVGGFHVQKPGDDQRADLLIFELGSNTDKEFQLIHSLLSTDAIGEVFIISKHFDSAVLLQAIRTGVKEFFRNPINEEEVRLALENFKKRNKSSSNKESAQIGQIINVIGSKGGVGTTTVAVNLAVALAEKKGVQSVALVDMNLLFGEVPVFLEIENKPKFHWGQITKNFSRLDSTFLMNILSQHPSGLYVLPSPGALNGHQKPTPEIIERFLGFMRTMFSFVIIDGGLTPDQTYLKILELSDLVFLISVLSVPCLSNTCKLLGALDSFGYPPRERIEVVINRYRKNSEISLKDAAKGIGKTISWTIPNDYQKTMSAINQGKTLFQIASKAPVTRSLGQLADSLLQSEPSQEQKRWKSLLRLGLMKGKRT